MHTRKPSSHSEHLIQEGTAPSPVMSVASITSSPKQKSITTSPPTKPNALSEMASKPTSLFQDQRAEFKPKNLSKKLDKVNKEEPAVMTVQEPRMKMAHMDYSKLFVGIGSETPVLNGFRNYVNLDNSASTPCLVSVQQTVNNFLEHYSSVHRGTGFKSQFSTHLYEEARQTVLDFVGADSSEHLCIFGKNTTEAVNKLARSFPFNKDRDIVLTTEMEHHSSDLPWRVFAPKTLHVAIDPQDGSILMKDLELKLKKYGHRIALVSITGASNVTGYVNPIHDIAKMAHAVGAQIYVDCAQLVAHRKIDMKPLSDPAHIDYIAFSAHKIYAPFGTGVLIARKDTFSSKREPDVVGGGTVALVTKTDIYWAEAPDLEEAGSPNTVGAIALAAALKHINHIGMDVLERHEDHLTRYAMKRLAKIPKVRVFGNTNTQPKEGGRDRVGVVTFIMKDIPYSKLAAILGTEFGIGVRSGCFCAHPYVYELLKNVQEDINEILGEMMNGDHSNKPGLIRASFGLHNTESDIDALVDALTAVSEYKFQGVYIKNKKGEFQIQNWAPPFEKYSPFVSFEDACDSAYVSDASSPQVESVPEKKIPEKVPLTVNIGKHNLPSEPGLKSAHWTGKLNIFRQGSKPSEKDAPCSPTSPSQPNSSQFALESRQGKKKKSFFF